MTYAVRPLDATTWDLFAELVERNGGVYGGCWCTAFHPDRGLRGVEGRRTAKEERVRTGRAHAALVLDADGVAQGWAQYGGPAELDLRHRREYDRAPPPVADWRITCVFVDKRHRGQGVARAAVQGALDLIAQAGGGRVEAISEVTAGRTAPGRFLFSGTVELLEDLGFARVRQVGKHAWIVSRVVAPA
jgi:GNAT superfamily N-acetyltransferase